MTETLSDLSADRRRQLVTELSRSLRISCKRDTPNAPARIRALFRILDACDAGEAARADRSLHSQAYRRLATLIRPAELAEHLCGLECVQLAEVLLRYWVPRYLVVDWEEPARSLDYGGKVRLTRSLPRAAGASRSTLSTLMSAFKGLRRHPANNPQASTADPLVDLLAVLTTGHVVNLPRFLTDLLHLIAAGETRSSLWHLFAAIRAHPALGLSAAHAKTVVLHLASSPSPTDLRLAFRAFAAVPTLSLLACPDLPLQLIEAGLGHPDRIFTLLNRKPGPDIPFPELRAVKRLALHPAHIDLAHLIAFAWANQARESSRVAFRRVWSVYRWLRDRGAPLSVLMSRSLVKAGVLRPLDEGERRQFGPAAVHPRACEAVGRGGRSPRTWTAWSGLSTGSCGTRIIRR